MVVQGLVASMKLMLDLLLVPVKTGSCDHALSTTYLLKSMSVASLLLLRHLSPSPFMEHTELLRP